MLVFFNTEMLLYVWIGLLPLNILHRLDLVVVCVYYDLYCCLFLL